MHHLQKKIKKENISQILITHKDAIKVHTGYQRSDI